MDLGLVRDSYGVPFSNLRPANAVHIMQRYVFNAKSITSTRNITRFVHLYFCANYTPAQINRSFAAGCRCIVGRINYTPTIHHGTRSTDVHIPPARPAEGRNISVQDRRTEIFAASTQPADAPASTPFRCNP